MDVFALRDKVVSDYRRYIESFVRIRDTKIEKFVAGQFESGVLWPDPILQLNPAYEPGRTVTSLPPRARSARRPRNSFADMTAARSGFIATRKKRLPLPPGGALRRNYRHRLRQEPDLSDSDLRRHCAQPAGEEGRACHHRLSDECPDQQPV